MLRAGRHVVSESVEGEVVMIDTSSGVYYSLDGTGAEVWDAAASGATADDLCAGMQRRYPETPGVEASVRAFVSELLAEGLLVDDGTGGDGATPASGEPPARAAFAPPVLNRYSDMAHILQLDPVHDVDAERGWPTAP